MSKQSRMTLADMYKHFYEAAGRSPGAWRGAQLPGGARFDVKRWPNGQVRVCLSREDKRLGDVELVTFCSHFKIPASAVRAPTDPSLQATQALSGAKAGKAQWYVFYTWMESPNDQQQPTAGAADRPAEQRDQVAGEQRSMF